MARRAEITQERIDLAALARLWIMATLGEGSFRPRPLGEGGARRPSSQREGEGALFRVEEAVKAYKPTRPHSSRLRLTTLSQGAREPKDPPLVEPTTVGWKE